MGEQIDSTAGPNGTEKQFNPLDQSKAVLVIMIEKLSKSESSSLEEELKGSNSFIAVTVSASYASIWSSPALEHI